MLPIWEGPKLTLHCIYLPDLVIWHLSSSESDILPPKVELTARKKIPPARHMYDAGMSEANSGITIGQDLSRRPLILYQLRAARLENLPSSPR